MLFVAVEEYSVGNHVRAFSTLLTRTRSSNILPSMAIISRTV